MKKIEDDVDSSIHLSTKFNRGWELFLKGEKQDFGCLGTGWSSKDCAVYGKGLDVDQKGWKFYRIFFEYFINLFYNFMSLKQHLNPACSLNNLHHF